MLLRKLSVRIALAIHTDAVRLYENSSIAELIKWSEVINA